MSAPEPFEAHWRRQLADYRSEATDADWSAMERHLPPTPGGRSAWPYTLLLIAVVALAGWGLFAPATAPPLSSFPVEVPAPLGPTYNRPDRVPSLLPALPRDGISTAAGKAALSLPALPTLRLAAIGFVADTMPARRSARLASVVTELPSLGIPKVRSSSPDHLATIGKTLIVVPYAPSEAGSNPRYNGLYPRLRQPTKDNR
ncbi:hypothetical protein CLV84_1569 [Neolewinella xylanilytica]|uniref:Uncharacterized protein n=1 Tax=Neolewinella xylanilytica TaxID=1514080 RepID=A0A2S6IAS3_9BACT|nr:hypothetical protein [Neolewinella xylanilytica]PPK88600.1 hypothetical protein CLV84_1569 [Neolewinella xylanilytica]